jgi:hypothetical protein
MNCVFDIYLVAVFLEYYFLENLEQNPIEFYQALNDLLKHLVE